MKKLLYLLMFGLLFGQATDLIDQTIGHPDSTYKQLLRFENNAASTDVLKQIFDGTGDSTALFLAHDSVNVQGVFTADELNFDEATVGDIYFEDIHIYKELTDTARSTYTGIDIIPDASSLAATSEYSAVDVTIAGGTSSGTVVGLKTHKDVAPINQSVEVFTTPSQTEYAGRKVDAGAFGLLWIDGVDGGEIFATDSSEVYIGSTSKFTSLEVIMTTEGTGSVIPTFWYNTAADTWTQFYPQDGTRGFQQNGSIYWVLPEFTSLWTNDGDPAGSDASTGYWIKIIRTADTDPGSPTPTTIKTGVATLYEWDAAGGIEIEHLKSTDDIEADGDLAIDGTSNLDNTDIDGTFTMDGTAFDVNSTTTVTIDNSNTTNGVVINAVTSASPISIGHTTSETTVNDNLNVTGDAAVDGTSNLDNTDIDGTFTMDGTAFDVNSTTTVTIDNSNTTNGIDINTGTSGSPVDIGHSTSETTIGDNLTVSGDQDVVGAFTAASVASDAAVSGTGATFTSINNSEGNITNVGDIALDSITADDGSTITVNDSTSFTDDVEIAGNASAATYGSDGSVSDAELLYINSLSSNAQTQITNNAALVDTDDELIAIINNSPSTQIGVPAGGTGVGTLNDGGLLVGAGTGAVEVLADGLTTQVLVGGGANVNPAWGTDIPTAVTIGSAYVYRVGGTDVADADLVDDITVTSTKQVKGSSLDATDGNITNVGDISLDTISSDAGTSIGVTLGSDAGDDFNIDGGGFVYEGDNNRVGIGTASPTEELEVNGNIESDNFELLSDYGGNLETAISTISTDSTTLIINTDPNALTGNLTIPANVVLDWQKGHVLQGADYVLTIDGGLEAGTYAIFGDTLLVKGDIQSENLNARWWEMTTNGSADNTVALQTAINSMSWLRKPLYIPSCYPYRYQVKTLYFNHDSLSNSGFSKDLGDAGNWTVYGDGNASNLNYNMGKSNGTILYGTESTGDILVYETSTVLWDNDDQPEEHFAVYYGNNHLRGIGIHSNTSDSAIKFDNWNNNSVMEDIYIRIINNDGDGIEIVGSTFIAEFKDILVVGNDLVSTGTGFTLRNRDYSGGLITLDNVNIIDMNLGYDFGGDDEDDALELTLENIKVVNSQASSCNYGIEIGHGVYAMLLDNVAFEANHVNSLTVKQEARDINIDNAYFKAANSPIVYPTVSHIDIGYADSSEVRGFSLTNSYFTAPNADTVDAPLIRMYSNNNQIAIMNNRFHNQQDGKGVAVRIAQYAVGVNPVASYGGTVFENNYYGGFLTKIEDAASKTSKAYMMEKGITQEPYTIVTLSADSTAIRMGSYSTIKVTGDGGGNTVTTLSSDALGGYGSIVRVQFQDANVTLDHAADNIYMASDLDYVSSNGDIIEFVKYGTAYYEIGRKQASFTNAGFGVSVPAANQVIEARGGLGVTGSQMTLSTSEPTVVDGNVLGKINFQAPLDAAGTDANLVGASIHAEADDTFAADNNSTELVFSTAASGTADEKMRIDHDGNVGIGTASPEGNLHIQSAGNIQGAIQIEDASAVALRIESALPTVVLYETDGNANENYQFRLSDGSLLFQAQNDAISSASTKFTLDHDGNVGIGEAAPDSTLEVNGSGHFTGNVLIEGTTINMTTSGTTLTVGVGADNGTVSAGVFTDRTPFYDGDAISAIKKIKDIDGDIDHSSLPKEVRIEINGQEERNLGSMVSVNVRALQQLIDKVEFLETELAKKKDK